MAAAPMRWLPMRWLRLLLVARWSVGFEEYEEMPSRWQAGKDGSRCAYAKPGMLPQAIRSRLAFFAFISMDEPEMLEHWLSWYGWLGAPVNDAARSLVVVHAPPGEAGSANAAATLAHLKAAGVSRVNETAVYSSRIKQTMVNDFIGRLPRDALLIYPDSDEFFAYPRDVEAVLATDGAVHGHMVERMASTWEFADVKPPKAAPIWDQFPLHCAVTAKHLGANHFKQMLTPMVDFEGNRVYYRSSHNVYCVNEKSRNPHPKHCVFRGNRSYAFGHYRFTRRAHALAEHKRDVYKAVLDGADTPEKAIADAADRDMLTYERTVVSQTWQYVKDASPKSTKISEKDLEAWNGRDHDKNAELKLALLRKNADMRDLGGAGPALARARPPEPGCWRGCEPATDLVVLYLVVSADNHLPLLPHFLDHWLSTLGVDPAHVFVDVNTNEVDDGAIARALAPVRGLLRDRGVPPAQTFDWTHSLFTSKEKRRRFDEVLRIPQAVAARVGERGAWIALADVDEFPLLRKGFKSLPQMLTAMGAEGFTVLAGYTVDRSRRDGSLEQPRPRKSIWAQFPVRSGITVDCEECRANKAVAYRFAGTPSTDWNSDKGGHHAEHFTLKSAKCESVEKWVEVAHFKWWGDLKSYLVKRTVAGTNQVAAATQEMLDVLGASKTTSALDVSKYDLRGEKSPTEIMRLEFVKNPELIPSCLGPRRTAALKHHLKSTAVSSGVVPFRPPRAARLKASAFDKTDDAWLALAREVANYCECRVAEHKISQVPAACANHLAPPTKPARLAVAILSYLPENAATLAETVCHYAMVPRLVASVLVQWNNAKVPPPAFNCSRSDDKYVTTVTVVAYGDNTLLNRYRRPELMGDGSVLLQDDDVRYSHRALRAFADVAPGVYMNPDKHGGDRIERQYNMLTGKTSVLDVATVASFFDDDRVPPAARDWIAQRHKPTCEDMTLHWHAATLRPNPPVWLQFSGDDALELDADLREPAADGHQTGEMHLDVANWGDLRSQCVDRLHDEFGNAPLVRSMCRLDLKDYRPGPRLDAVKQKKSKVDQLAAAAALEAGARAMAQLKEYEPVLATQASQLGALVQSSSDAGFVAHAATARADLAEARAARRALRPRAPHPPRTEARARRWCARGRRPLRRPRALGGRAAPRGLVGGR
ncbi:glucuronosyl-N-acetylglucosaminyl-proteoglycan 4-alpha-N-acetylglucosaminyltransferase [Aureococcus anophagefferens]|nr:glucuronosyl-N-acetylglucosaminyl-proteoglycan 4-alpha-N-acetylglucosaminyltransferase [Aureococcus anophagefferens]